MFAYLDFDGKRIRSAAMGYINEQPTTIVSVTCPRSPGGKGDYYSEGDYWWPDPENPTGPYVQRDGMSNPDNFTAHRKLMARLSVQVPALAAACLAFDDKSFAEPVARHLRSWFVDEETRMNPNLQYAQAIHGRCTGRGIGIIDTMNLVGVALAVMRLEKAGYLNADTVSPVKEWFADYLRWITTHQYGIDESNAHNNHGTCWVLQAAAFASLLDDSEILADCRRRFTQTLLPEQMAPDGSFPKELKRTKPYGYSIFNLDIMAGICQLLSTPDENLWQFETADGRSMSKGMEFLYPYLKDKNSWPYPPDVMHHDHWPLRQPCLLFAGIAMGRDDYIDLWKTLDPDPTEPELIRNYPIRQPALWVTRNW